MTRWLVAARRLRDSQPGTLDYGERLTDVAAARTEYEHALAGRTTERADADRRILGL
jgi:hypothetical protein